MADPATVFQRHQVLSTVIATGDDELIRRKRQ